MGLYDRIKDEKEPKEEKQNEEDSFAPYNWSELSGGVHQCF